MALAWLLWAGPVRAAGDFGRIQPISMTSAATDQTAGDFDAQLATNGRGVWGMAATELPGGTLGITGQAPVLSRSVDDGRTWTPLALLRPETNTHLDAFPTVATDGHGKWILVWGASPAELRMTTSEDDGQSWSTSSLVFPAMGHNFIARIRTDGLGTWIVAWTSANTLGGTIAAGYNILFIRSTDNGVTWSAAAPLNSTAYESPYEDNSSIEIATDGAGTWVAVWSKFAQAWCARSTDNGASWGAAVPLGHVGWQGTSHPSVASNGAGRWVAVWTNYDNSYDPSSQDVWWSASSDHGATWSIESKLHPHAAEIDTGYASQAEVVSLGGGLWSVVFTEGNMAANGTGRDPDMRISTSRDDGLSWSSPAALTVGSGFDGDAHDFAPDVVASSGTVVVAWQSQNSLGGTIGSDFDILFARASRDCPSTARNDCFAAMPGGSSLRLRDKVGGADRLKWRWRSSVAGSDLELGDPTATDSYVVCLYEKVGSAAGLIGEWDAAAGGTCRGGPCWTKASGSVRLADGGLERGSIRGLSVMADASGSRIKLLAKGPALALPRLPLDPAAPIRVQLINAGTGACWEGTHTSASRNELEYFQSVSD